ncbi:MAG: recombinase family protein [Bdellovibrionales bacterium]|nr:recombinase family protein [Bdellovibrionales bacterium]
MDSNRFTALYARVSTLAQGSGLESQLNALETHCKRNSVESYRIYTDEGISGAKSSRPGLDKLMDDVRQGHISQVVVFSFSRFARSTKHLLLALEEFNSLGVRFVSISESLDTSTPIGKTVFSILAAISELERELIRERVRNGLVNARRKGKRLGRAKTRNSDLIQELRAKGLSYRRIAKLCRCSISTVHKELNSSPFDKSKPKVK